MEGGSLGEVRGGDLADADLWGSTDDASSATALQTHQAYLRQLGAAQPAGAYPQGEAPTRLENLLGGSGGGGVVSPQLCLPPANNDGRPAADPPRGIPTASAAAPADETTATTAAAASVPARLPATAVPAAGAAAAVPVPAAISSPASPPGAGAEPVGSSPVAAATEDSAAMYGCDADGPGAAAIPPVDSSSSTRGAGGCSLQDRSDGFQAPPPVVKRPSFTRPPLAKAMLQHQYRRQLAEARGEAGTADDTCGDLQ